MDFVSFVDIESQKIFTKQVATLFPEDIVMGEEEYDVDRDYSQCEHLWIIDPVDGTLLFKRGIPLFGIMIAYLYRGEIQLSAIFLPALDELYHADKIGAYSDNQRIYVSNIKKLASAVIQVSDSSRQNFFDNPDRALSFSKSIGTSFDAYSMAYALIATAS